MLHLRRARLDQPEIGLDLLDEAIKTVELANERFFEPELYRLQGNMLLTLGKRGPHQLLAARLTAGMVRPTPRKLRIVSMNWGTGIGFDK